MLKQGDNRNIRVLQFLDAYESQESLWNPALESYKNKLSRDEAYMHIIKQLNVPSLTIHDIKLKVKSIRTTYTKELRLLTKHKEEGKPYTPKLFWFNRANAFLKNVSLSRDKRTNISKHTLSPDEYKPFEIDYNIEVSNRQNETLNEALIETNHPAKLLSSSCDYKTIHIATPQFQEEDNHQDSIHISNSHIQEEDNHQASIPDQQSANVRVQQSFLSRPSAETKFTAAFTSDVTNNILECGDHQTLQFDSKLDEFDLFCRSVASQLRSISDTYSRSVAKLKIQQILFEAETGHYRSSPCITIPVTQTINNL